MLRLRARRQWRHLGQGVGLAVVARVIHVCLAAPPPQQPDVLEAKTVSGRHRLARRVLGATSPEPAVVAVESALGSAGLAGAGGAGDGKIDGVADLRLGLL